MYRLKLVGLRSYSGIVRATAAQPYVELETEKQAQEILATGHFELCSSETISADSGKTESKHPDYEALSAMTKSELTEYAESAGISLENCKTKAEMLKTISMASGGSSTMIDLQQ